MDSIKMLMLDSSMFITNLDILGYKRMGLSVKCADSFKKAESLLLKENFDVIVMNLDYEDFDYIKFSKYIRESKKYSDMLLVLTSVRTGGRVKEIYRQINADLFVNLPIPKEVFIEKIKSLLDQSVRNTTRVKLMEEARFEVKGSSYPCVVDDLSGTGVSIWVKDSIEEDSGYLNFYLYLDNEVKKELKVECSIVRSRKKDSKLSLENDENRDYIEDIEDYKYFIGLRFENLKEEDKRNIMKYIAIVTKNIDKMTYYI